MITIWQRVISKLDVAKSNETDNKLKLMASFCRSVVCVCWCIFSIRLFPNGPTISHVIFKIYRSKINYSGKECATHGRFVYRFRAAIQTNGYRFSEFVLGKH